MAERKGGPPSFTQTTPGYGQPYTPSQQQGYIQPQYPPPPTLQYQQQHNVIITQPGAVGTVITGQPPEDYMLRAIIATFFCFWPVGMFAILKANESKQAYNRGDIAAAHSLAESARNLSNIAIGVGGGSVLAVLIIVIIFIAV